jgi:hypothetical protein
VRSVNPAIVPGGVPVIFQESVPGRWFSRITQEACTPSGPGLVLSGAAGALGAAACAC